MIKDFCQGTQDPHQFFPDIMPSIGHLTESDLKALIDRFIDVKIRLSSLRNGSTSLPKPGPPIAVRHYFFKRELSSEAHCALRRD